PLGRHRTPPASGRGQGLCGVSGRPIRCSHPPGWSGTGTRPVCAIRLMKVCIVGSGGREHALARALTASASVVVTPGHPGIAALGAGITCTASPPEAIDADLYIVGPEAALVEGLADRLRAAGKRVLGPGADGARLEGSKAWMKQILVD